MVGREDRQSKKSTKGTNTDKIQKEKDNSTDNSRVKTSLRSLSSNLRKEGGYAILIFRLLKSFLKDKFTALEYEVNTVYRVSNFFE